MKFNEHWLREWVNPAWSSTQLSDALTMAGLEVDAVTPVAAEFAGVVVAEVLSVAPHPDADKLRVCQVADGSGEVAQIVCGAPNVAVGMKAPLARVGATLPGGLTIKRAKLRGVESAGMLCSAKELGLAEVSEGLLALDGDATVGRDIRDYLALDDVTIELGLTPNRGDCLSVLGIAREVAALSGAPLQKNQPVVVPATLDETFPVELQAPAACPRYLGRVIRGVAATTRSPLWLRERLRRCGLRSINAAVDVTNYVMWELGQPLHAFDLAQLSGGIVVRMARAGERLTLLDGRDIALAPDTLVIADHAKVLAVAGIMGGEHSGIGEHTEAVFLESAFFAPTALAGRARRHGLQTDSSHRFERGVDPSLARRAIERATELLLEIAGGRAGPVVEAVVEADLPSRPPITLRAARLQRVLGAVVEDAAVVSHLQRLGLTVETQPDGWRVTPPSHRFDISIEADLIEEVARIESYSRLPGHRPRGPVTLGQRPEGRVTAAQWRAVLVERGYQEAITYSFVDPELQALLNPGHPGHRLLNPISAELAEMRTSLWPGLIAAVRHNHHRQQERCRVFEIATRFLPQADGSLREEPVIAGVVTGALLPVQWGEAARAADFFDLKADVEALLDLTGRAQDFIFATQPQHPALHPGLAARVMTQAGDEVGWLGALHPQLDPTLGLAGRAYLFELRTEVLMAARAPVFSEISRFPAVRRDLALVVAETVSAQALCDQVRAAAGEFLREIQLFDVYQGAGLPLGTKSLALRLTWAAASRTLADAEIDDCVTGIVAAVARELGGRLRG